MTNQVFNQIFDNELQNLNSTSKQIVVKFISRYDLTLFEGDKSQKEVLGLFTDYKINSVLGNLNNRLDEAEDYLIYLLEKYS